MKNRSLPAGFVKDPEQWFGSVLDDTKLLPVLNQALADKRLARRLFDNEATRIRVLGVFAYCLMHDSSQALVDVLLRLMLQKPAIYALPFVDSWFTPPDLRHRLLQLRQRPGYNLLFRYIEAAAGIGLSEAMALLDRIAVSGGRWDRLRAAAAKERAEKERLLRAAEKVTEKARDTGSFVDMGSLVNDPDYGR